MYPTKTFELKIDFSAVQSRAEQTKELVKSWLRQHEVDTFVEGAIDHLDLDPSDTESDSERYEAVGGERSPISIFKFDVEALSLLKSRIEEAFGAHLNCQMLSHQTSQWVDGWKDSFKPITTEKFFIYPPWDKDKIPEEKITLEIEPAMAFGTGQHATTILCLKRLEEIASQIDVRKRAKQTCADIGTGTGILAIALKKLGFQSVTATDIDTDAIQAAKTNSKANFTKLELFLGSIPPTEGKTFEIVVANILAPVILKLMPELAKITAKDGHLVLSGLLVENETEIVNAAKPHGFILQATDHISDWSCLYLKKA